MEFSIGVFDPRNNRPVTNVQVGDEILVRVSVDDLIEGASPEGVASAFLDLLYTDELVSTLDTDNNPDFPFDISFGPLFSGVNVLQRGNAQVPGLIDEVGGLQRIDNQQEHAGPVELFTLKMKAVSPGVAIFQADPADELISETVLLGSDVALLPSQLRLGSTELLILPNSDNFTSAIDDSYPDSFANSSASSIVLDVLANDNLGETGIVREFELNTANNPSLGSVEIDRNGTPDNANDDRIIYRPNAFGANGLDSFTYVIVTDDNVRSTAEVTVALGNQNLNSQVAYDFELVSGDGSNTPISEVRVGDRFGVEIHVEDLRANPTFVFAGFMDLLYDSGIITPSDTDANPDFDFDVVFGPNYNAEAGVGTAARPGIIDEFGTLFSTASPSLPVSQYNPGLLATIYFEAVNVGTTTVVGSPADFSPFQDTLLFDEDNPIDRGLLRFDTLPIRVDNGAPLQNRSLPQDVNNDGSVSPIDALLIINQMNRFGVSSEGEFAASTSLASTYFTDVNGDNTTSALDALQVINYLTRMSNVQANGEQIAIIQRNAAASPATSESSDDVFAELGDEPEKLVAAGAADPVAAQQLPLIDSVAGDGEDEDDILSLLADDVTGLWS